MLNRKLPEPNAGSMADIAFLLLIFWLVSTTISVDEGIARKMSDLNDDIQASPRHQRNIFEVRINNVDSILIEGERADVNQLKEKCREFLIANGDGILHPWINDIEDLPVRKLVTEDDVLNELHQLKMEEQARKLDYSEVKKVERLNRRLRAIRSFGSEFYALPSSSLISVSCLEGTSYGQYIEVQNELEGALSELRDELCLKKFGETYADLEKRIESEDVIESEEEKLFAIRQVYPQLVTDAEKPKE